MALQRLDVRPLGLAAGRGQGGRGQDLQAADAVEEDGDAAEISVFPQSGLEVRGRLGRRFHDADLIA